MTESQAETDGATTTRRAMLAGAGALGASTLLAACGTDDGSSLASGTGSPSAAATTHASSGATTGAATGGGTAALAKTSDIPAGGGKVFKAQGVVVTQPVKGTFKGFSAVCTHAGCTVGPVEGGLIKCGCHGSQFSIEDGSVKKGPATQDLSAINVKSAGGSITLA
jgi:nitrite reductase/ring-hydroxylating ferredoxin subunit